MLKKIITAIVAIAGAITGFLIGARSGGLTYRDRISRADGIDKKFRDTQQKTERRLSDSIERIENGQNGIDDDAKDLRRIRAILENASKRNKKPKPVK